MIKRLTHITIAVRDQDEALKWYTQKLGFAKKHDERESIPGFRLPGFRWLTVSPNGQESPEIVLLKAQDGAAVGRGTMWVLEVDDCSTTYEELRARGVTFRSAPEEAPWGVSAVFEDLYGNPFHLLEPRLGYTGPTTASLIFDVGPGGAASSGRGGREDSQRPTARDSAPEIGGG